MELVRHWRKVALIAVVGLPLCYGLYRCVLFVKKPHAPAIIVVSECKSTSLDMKRIQVGDNLAFFATDNTSARKGQTDDTPPFTQRFCLRAKDAKSLLTISLHPSEGFNGAPPIDPMIVFSEYSERRHVVDGTGRRTIGEDYWGYLDSEKRWRKIRLEGVSAEYGAVAKSEARTYDRILSSACFSTP
jgi:hypothetical protein